MPKALRHLLKQLSRDDASRVYEWLETENAYVAVGEMRDEVALVSLKKERAAFNVSLLSSIGSYPTSNGPPTKRSTVATA